MDIFLITISMKLYHNICSLIIKLFLILYGPIKGNKPKMEGSTDIIPEFVPMAVNRKRDIISKKHSPLLYHRLPYGY